MFVFRAELPALSETIVRANLEDNMVAVEKMALALYVQNAPQ